MTGFKSPNYTQAPNELFDELMAVMGEAELRVVLVAVRKTLGYHKTYDAISLSQFEQMSGLSRRAVIDGLGEAKERGLIRELDKRGARGVKLYALVIESHQSTTFTSTSERTSPVTSEASTHTKERETKEKERKKDSAPQNGAVVPPTRPRDLLFDAVQVHVFGIPLEEKANGGRIGKISNWLNGKFEGKGSARVGFISAPAQPEHVEKFAAWCKAEGFTAPRDVVKFVEQWRRWAATANHATPKAPEPVVDTDFQAKMVAKFRSVPHGN